MSLHEHLLGIVKKLPTDFEPYGQRDRGTAAPSEDCSCGCRHFIPLAGDLGNDWGVCANPNSPRCGLLTFEHMGCPQFESVFEQVMAGAEEGVTARAIDPLAPEIPLKQLKVNQQDFLVALEQGFGAESTSYLDLQSGEVVTLFEDMGEDDEIRDRVEADPERYAFIERIDSHESFRIMENFARSLRESGTKDRLLAALSRNKPFRQFKDAVNQNAALREQWFAFHEKALIAFARDWLEAKGIAVEWAGPGARTTQL